VPILILVDDSLRIRMHYLVTVHAHTRDALLVVVLATLTVAPVVVAHHILSATVAHTPLDRRLGRLRICEVRSGHGLGLLRVVPHGGQASRGDLRYHLQRNLLRRGRRLRHCAIEKRRMCVKVPWGHGRSCGRCGNLHGRRRRFRPVLQRHEVLRRVGS
jgi:hypothetical protein